ncbi:MAG: Na/Pi symporter [Bacillota bacterium]
MFLPTGLVLVLFGLRLLQSGLLCLSSGRLTTALRSLSINPTRSSLSGLVASALTQSSTAVSIITIGLAHSRIINLSQAIAVILGANVGTTLTVQFLSLNPGIAMLPFCAAGIPIAFSRSPAKPLGQIFVGVGMIFSGLDLLNRAFEPLQHAPWFAAGLAAAGSNYLLAVSAAAVLTAFLHSSSAATGIVMALYAQGAVSLETAVALVLGNNIGTCFTALIASLTSSAAGKRVALAHLLLNIIGAVVFLPLIRPFSFLIGITSSFPARQVANAHVIYNLASSLIALPFCNQLARILERIIPDRATW